MAVSLAIILILGLFMNKIFEKLKLPGLLGMLIVGVAMGPYGLDMISSEIMTISSDLRKIALIVILLRAGFGLNRDQLNKVGGAAIRMSSIPGIMEGFAVLFIAMYLFDIPFVEAGMLGFIAGGAIGFVILEKDFTRAKRLSLKFNKVWVLAEILLFVLVGAQVNINVMLDSGVLGLLIILGGLIFRSLGVMISLLGTKLEKKEKLFSVIAYIPKATVQAAMGAVPLSLGVPSGELILAVSVLAIVVTAPLGAIGIKIAGEKLLD